MSQRSRDLFESFCRGMALALGFSVSLAAIYAIAVIVLSVEVRW